MDLETSDFLHLGGSYPLEVVDMADVAGETNKYMDIVDTVDTCRIPSGLSESSIACRSSIKGGLCGHCTWGD